MDDLGCPFRKGIRLSKEGEVAECHFAARLTGASPELCLVHRSACDVCAEGAPLSPLSVNPVMPSIILEACQSVDDAVPIDDSVQSSAIPDFLRAWAEATITKDGVEATVSTAFACDVIIDARFVDQVMPLRRAINSVLVEPQTHVTLHVVLPSEAGQRVDLGQQAGTLFRRPNLKCYWCDEETLPQVLNRIVAAAQSQTITFLDASSVFLPKGLKQTLHALNTTGAELVFARTESDHCLGAQKETLETAVSAMAVRLASIADLGHFDQACGEDCISEICRRALMEARPIHFADHTMTRIEHGSVEPAFVRSGGISSEPTQALRRASVRLVRDRVQCDVVVPFRDGTDFAIEAIESVLAQADADLTIHVIDDASRHSVAALFERYRESTKVRLYSNLTNLGPFATFNNIIEFASSPFIAVQDADDISLPHRIAHSVSLMQQSKADLFAGATELFGDSVIASDICHRRLTLDGENNIPVRRSRYACKNTRGYFVENPTLVVRRDAFIALGGYADFGERNRNRTGIDTDLQLRAHYARFAFAVTNDVVVRYRCHSVSATQHHASKIGSQANREAAEEVRRRLKLYAQGSFNPKWFGAIGQYRGQTRPLE